MQQIEHLYVGGRRIPPRGEGRLRVVDPAREEVIGSVPDAAPADVDRAVTAARDAFEGWAAVPVPKRVAALERIAAGIRQERDELAELITAEVGAPVRLARNVQVGLASAVFQSTARALADYAFEEELGSSLVLREPVGVVGAITPWNFPLLQIATKVAPALAAGCPVVVKPSEVAPLATFRLAEIIHQADLPPGVFNLVTGVGPVVGEALAGHPQVDMVSFTGSTRAGRRVAEVGATTVKRVTLELGGKSASLVLPDADLERAVVHATRSSCFNSGQTCSALTRLLVPRERQEEAAEIAAGEAASLTIGDPRDDPRLGPLVSEAQRERVRGYLRRGEEEGARRVTGGPEAPQDLPRGFYVRPTVFADVTPDMTIAREEIFGPVLSILPYDDEDHAVTMANDSIYGLAGAVWSADPDHAKAIARRLRTGQVDINGGRFNILAPFGGYKQSGNGREYGTFGLEEYLEIKSLQL